MKRVKSTFLTPSAVTFEVSCKTIKHPALLSTILMCFSASKIQFFDLLFKTRQACISFIVEMCAVLSITLWKSHIF